MKEVLAAFLLMFCYSVCSAQGGDKISGEECAEEWCREMYFPYKFCDANGNYIKKCSKDPNNEPGLKPLKRQIPLQVEYQDWTSGEDTIFFHGPGEPMDWNRFPLYNYKHVKKWAELAAKTWSALCPPQGPDTAYPPCVLKILWSDSPNLVGEAQHDNPAFTVIEHSPGRCQTDCSSSMIVLNQTEQFLRRDGFDRPRYFILTERENHIYIPNNYGYLDAYTVFLHELGHWLGFEHSDEPTPPLGAKCEAPGSIMKSVWRSHEFGELSEADKCMFRKAYCCKQTQTIVWTQDPNIPPPDYTPNAKTTTGDSWGKPAFGFTVAPNPATSETITLSLYNLPGSGTTTIRIADADGNTVLRKQLEGANTREISLDVGMLPNGMYMIELVREEGAFSRKFLVTE